MAVRILVIILLFVFTTFQICTAIDKPNKKIIKESQIYGASNYLVDLDDFLKPWASFEGENVIITKNSEVSYLYTPFLLVALDAREKTSKKEKITFEESNNMLKQYNEYFVFNTVFSDYDSDFLNNAKVFIEQGKSIFEISQINVIDKEHYLNKESIDMYKINCYLYFQIEKLSLKEPIKLIIESEKSRTRYFHFNLAEIR